MNSFENEEKSFQCDDEFNQTGHHSGSNLHRVLFVYPVMTMKVISGDLLAGDEALVQKNTLLFPPQTFNSKRQIDEIDNDTKAR